jgi:hypothetical protein
VLEEACRETERPCLDERIQDRDRSRIAFRLPRFGDRHRGDMCADAYRAKAASWPETADFKAGKDL